MIHFIPGGTLRDDRPTMNAFEATEKNGCTDELHQQLVAAAEAHNTNKSGGVTIGSTFMRVTVKV